MSFLCIKELTARCYGLIAWLIVTMGYSQTPKIDSLKVILPNSTGQQRADVLNQLSFRSLVGQLDNAQEYASQALQLSQRLGYKRGVAEATIYQGIYQLQRGARGQSATLLRAGAALAHQYNLPELKGYAFAQLGNLFLNYVEFDSAKHYYDIAYTILRDSLHPRELSIVYRNLSRHARQTFQPLHEKDYLERALRIRLLLHDHSLLADVYTLLGQWYLDMAELDHAIDYLNRAEEVGRLAGPQIIHEIKGLRAAVLFRQANYPEALRLYQEAKHYYRDQQAWAMFARLLNNMGEVLWEAGSYDVSLSNHFEALAIARKKNFIIEEVRANLGITWNYYRLKQFEVARAYLNEAKTTSVSEGFIREEALAHNLTGLLLKAEKKFAEALPHFQKAYQLRVALQDKKGEGTALGNLGETLEAIGLLKEALDTLQKSLTIKQSLLHQSGIAWAYHDLGSVHLKLRNYTEALTFLNKAERKAHEIKLGVVLVEAMSKKRDLLIASGRMTEALRYSLRYEQVKDSIQNTVLTNRIVGLQSSYEIEKRNREIELLRLNQKIRDEELLFQKSQVSRQRIIIGLGSLAIALLAGFGYSTMRNSKRTAQLNAEIEQKSKEIGKANFELRKANASLTERQHEIQAQADEILQTNEALTSLNRILGEKQEEIQAQSEELTEANQILGQYNHVLAEKQEELQAQAEELRKTNEMIAQLNTNLEEKVKARTQELELAYKELDTFFYRSSHDFRRPLTTFMGLAEVAKITVQDKGALNLFEKVRETAVQLDRMLVKLQSISDVGTQQFVYKPINMQQAIEASLDSYRDPIRQKGVKVSLSLAEVKGFTSYPAFLKIILDNLVENAIQFSARENPALYLAAEEKNSGLEVTVRDNGLGIEADVMDRIFDMFFRGHELSRGNGLGLYIVKKAVQKLGGRVCCESEPDKGSKFTVWLPSHEPASAV
jgi:signal transduction histidine kinase/tetratricopeptide (TPR) repeat protein